MVTCHVYNRENRVVGTVYVPEQYFGLIQVGLQTYEWREDHNAFVWKADGYPVGTPIFNVGFIVVENGERLIP